MKVLERYNKQEVSQKDIDKYENSLKDKQI